MNSIFEVYQGIKEVSGGEDAYNVAAIPGAMSSYIGITPEEYPILFIECSDNQVTPDLNLNYLKVNFNKRCTLKDCNESSTHEKDYAIILLKSKDTEMLKYFFEIVSMMLMELGPNPSTSDLAKNIGTIKNLFKERKTVSKDLVLGLWAELLVIDRSNDPAYMIDAWHELTNDKYDFNDGMDKIEVKATGCSERKHSFALEQLHPNDGSKLVVASVMSGITGLGMSVFDLSDKISARIMDIDRNIKMRKIILDTVGPNIDKVEQMTFDYAQGVDSLAYYSPDDIPSIARDLVPSEVTGVHFTSNLSDVEPLDENRLSDCRLHSALK